MKKDPIIEEVRKAGENLAIAAGNDVHAFFTLLREGEKRHSSRVCKRNQNVYPETTFNNRIAVCADSEICYK